MPKNLFICFCVLPILMMGQDQRIKFKHLTMEDGLSQSSITCITKDGSGFMWFGTEDGLNRYDGSSFTVFRHMPNDDQSLSSSYITAIVEQVDGFLWIGTKNGLNYFDPNTEKFTRYLQDSASNLILGENRINTLLLCEDENLLIGTGKGLYAYHPKTGISKCNRTNANEQNNIISLAGDKEGYLWVLSSDMLEKCKLENGILDTGFYRKSLKYDFKHTMLLDSLNLWLGTTSGLMKLNLRDQTSNVYRFYGSKDSPDVRDRINSIISGQKGNLLLGSFGGGIIDFDTLTSKFQTVLPYPFSHSHLNSNIVSSLFLGDKGILWGAFGGGINKYDPKQFKFEHYKNIPGNANTLSNNSVRALLLDSDGELWVGTQGGLNRIERKTGRIKVYKHVPYDRYTISSDVVRALQEDSHGIIWAGTWFDGLNSFNKKSGEFKRYISLPGRSDSIGQVRALETDHQGNIWFGNKDLWKFNPTTDQYKSYILDAENNTELDPKGINCLYFDKTGLLWIGRQDGLKSIDTVANRIKEYRHDPKDSLSIGHNYITSIAADKHGSLWVGTYGGGINKLNVSKGTFQHYNTGNGLRNDVIYGLLIDKQGYIWFTSNAGLGRFDPNREVFKYFEVKHGIQSMEFNAGAFFKSKEGEFFFGGINGFNSFFPSKINNEKETSRIVFTSFKLLDDKESSTKKVLDRHISRTEHIKLKHNQNTFTIGFAELNYSENVDNNYEYQLEGFEKNWQNLGKNKVITLANLKTGNHRLHVRVQNDLSKKTSINITVFPPLWRTNWAYLIYLLAIISVITLTYRNVKKFQRTKRDFEAKIANWESSNTTPTPEISGVNTSNSKLTLQEVPITSMNQKFVNRAIQLVEENISDSSFGVENFMDEMFMSRSQLHRKLKASTGYSTTKFIRYVRLQRAAQLLKGNTATVSEIAYEVGFENVGYFSKCFTETFGKPPSQYS